MSDRVGEAAFPIEDVREGRLSDTESLRQISTWNVRVCADPLNVPIGQGHIARVACLLFTRCPATVFRAIALVVVNPLYRETIRFFTHIGQEVDEPVLASPALTDGNATPAITWIGGIVCLCAA